MIALKKNRDLVDELQKEIVVTNNDILRRIRYIFDFKDAKMVEIFASVDHLVTLEEISHWLKKEDDSGFEECSNAQLAGFLNGFIIEKRGKKEGTNPKPEQRLNNNIILRKLKIALDLKADDVLDILTLGSVRISKHELSAFFRRPNHKHYRDCKDQILRNFLVGVQLRYRDKK